MPHVSSTESNGNVFTNRAAFPGGRELSLIKLVAIFVEPQAPSINQRKCLDKKVRWVQKVPFQRDRKTNTRP